MLAPIVLAACGGGGPGGDGAARLLGGDDGGARDGGGAPPASFVLRGDDGELAIEVGASGSLAADFPAAVPIPSGWTLDQSSRMTADGIIVWTTIWSTDEGPEQAADAFAAGLGAGLPEILRYSTDADGVYSVVGGWEGSQLLVSAGFLREGPSTAPTVVSLTVSDQPAVMAGIAGGGDASGDGPGAPAGGLVGAIGGDEAVDVLSSIGIGAKANGLAVALGGAFEVVDEMTARLILDGGSIDDQIFDCIVVGAVIDPGESVILVYPDGQVTC